jgi:hypothetical protein
MRRIYLFAVIILVAIPALTVVRVACPQSVSCEAGGEEVKILGVEAELHDIHCKGLEYNVSVSVLNTAEESQDVFVQIDGWDLDIGMHVTGGYVPVHLNPGEVKTVWAMLPIDSQTPKPSYYFNASIVPIVSNATHAGQGCICRPGEQIPLYKYLLVSLGRRGE